MRLIRAALFALFLFAAFAVVAVLMMPKERIARVASAEMSQALGRDVEITGDLSLSFWPVLGVRTGPVRVASPDWAGDAPLLKAEAMSIGVGAAAALKRQIDIRKVEMIAPEVTLVRGKDGRESWAFGESGGGESAGVKPFSLEVAEVRGGLLTYEDRAAGTIERLRNVDARLAMPKMDGPLRLELSGVRGQGRLAIDARFDVARDFIAGRLTPVRASVSTAGGTAEFDGLMTRALDADGQLSVSAGNTSAFLAALGLGAAEMPKGLGQSIELNSKLIFAGGKVVNLRGMTLGLDQNTLTGDADIRLDGPRPKVTAKLSTGALDLSSLSAEGGSSGDSVGWSKAPIDASGLSAMDAAVSLTAQSLDAGMVKLGATEMSVTVDNARAVMKLAKAEGYAGQIVGQFVINNRNGLSVGGDLSLLQGDVQPLLKDLMDVERLSGKADAFVKFLGVGSSLDAIMRSLSGNGGIAMGQGTISGFDLNALMGTGNGARGTTVFDAMSASFDMKGGILSNDNLTMSLPRFRATGKGQVNLGVQTLDYRFVPVALQANSGKDLAFPVRIRGPWADPRIEADIKAAIDLNLADKKQEVKTKVEDKVKEKLGVATEEGQSLEDALKKKAEDSLKKELLKIFE